MSKVVDLSAHINECTTEGGPAVFPISLRPLHFAGDYQEFEPVPGRFAVVREDTFRPSA